MHQLVHSGRFPTGQVFLQSCTHICLASPSHLLLVDREWASCLGQSKLGPISVTPPYGVQELLGHKGLNSNIQHMLWTVVSELAASSAAELPKSNKTMHKPASVTMPDIVLLKYQLGRGGKHNNVHAARAFVAACSSAEVCSCTHRLLCIQLSHRT